MKLRAARNKAAKAMKADTAAAQKTEKPATQVAGDEARVKWKKVLIYAAIACCNGTGDVMLKRGMV